MSHDVSDSYGVYSTISKLPFFLSLSTAYSRARLIEPTGLTTPSSRSTPTRSLPPRFTSRHGLTCRLGSYSHGRASAMMRMISSRSSTERPIGPSVEMIPSYPAAAESVSAPVLGTRPIDGLNEKMPHAAAGERTLPPMSEPTPSGDPRIARSAPSPPVLPPGTRSTFHGFSVSPHADRHSRCMTAWQLIVRT